MNRTLESFNFHGPNCSMYVFDNNCTSEKIDTNLNYNYCYYNNNVLYIL